MRFREIDIHVREAKTDDREKILEFRKLYPFNHFNDCFPNLRSKIIDILFGRDYKLFICEVNGEVVGCVASVKNSLHRNIYKIDDFFVLPHFRQLKIGKKLCASCYELIDRGKNTKFYSSVEASNIPSRKVFEGLGNKPFRFGIFYSVYKRNGEFKSNYGVRDLGPELLKWGRINYLYSIFNEIVGEEYFSFFNKTKQIEFSVSEPKLPRDNSSFN